MLRDDLKVFKKFDSKVYIEMTELATLDNFRWCLFYDIFYCLNIFFVVKGLTYIFVPCRENEKLKSYKDTQTQRIAMFKEIEKLVQSNPMIGPKLMLPNIPPTKRLPAIINQRFCLWPRLFIKKFSFIFRTSLEHIYILWFFPANQSLAACSITYKLNLLEALLRRII